MPTPKTLSAEAFQSLRDRAAISALPGDEAVAIRPDGSEVPSDTRTLSTVTLEWFGYLAETGTRITDEQMQSLVGPTGIRTSFVIGDSDWRRPSGSGDWEKVA